MLIPARSKLLFLGVDTQAAFNRVLAPQHSSNIAWDRVHPNAVGHMVLARAFLGAFGYGWQAKASA